jgi:hypothetical protein
MAWSSEGFVVLNTLSCQLVASQVGVSHPDVCTVVRKDIIATGIVPLKLHTLFAPPNNRDGVVHQTRQAAETDQERFDWRRS